MLPTFKEQLAEANRNNIPYPPLVESNKKTASCYKFPHRYQAATLAAKKNLTSNEEIIFKKIYKWTWDKAAEFDHPPRRLIHEKDLAKLAKIQPISVDDFPKLKIYFHPLLEKAIGEIIPLLATPLPEETTVEYFEYDIETDEPMEEVPCPPRFEHVETAKLCMNCFATDHLVSLPCPNPTNKVLKKKWEKEHPEYVRMQKLRRSGNRKKKRVNRTNTRRKIVESAAQEMLPLQQLLHTVTSLEKGGVVMNQRL